MKKITKENEGVEWYIGIAILSGIVSFACIWLYALLEWGLLLGLLFGWLPALIGGFFIGLLWPVVVIIMFWIYKSA